MAWCKPQDERREHYLNIPDLIGLEVLYAKAGQQPLFIALCLHRSLTPQHLGHVAIQGSVHDCPSVLHSKYPDSKADLDFGVCHGPCLHYLGGPELVSPVYDVHFAAVLCQVCGLLRQGPDITIWSQTLNFSHW